MSNSELETEWERRLLEMVESAPDAMFLVGSGGRIVLANARAETMFGIARADLIGSPVERLVPERFRDGHSAHRLGYVDAPATREMGAGLDLWAVRADGVEFPVEISLSPVGSGDDRATIASVRDVSERLEREAQLHLIQASIDATQDCVFMFAPDSLRFSYVNQSGVDRLGFSMDELEEMTPPDLQPEVSTDEFRRMIEPLVSGAMVRRTFETTHVTKAGGERPVEVSLEYPPAPHSYTDRQMVAIVRDITERLASDRERDRRRRWLEGLAEIRNLLLVDSSIHDVFESLCRVACDISGGDVALVRVADGDSATGQVAAAFPVDESEAAIVVDAAAQVMTIPLVTAERPIGDLVVVRRADVAFSAEEAEVAESFVEQAATAIEATQARGDRQRLRLLEDRDRIARDLHDLVIQRLFATGMNLQATSSLVSSAEVKDRMTRSVEEIDTAIDELRATIYGLHSMASEEGLAQQIEDLVGDHADRFGFDPDVELGGDLDGVSTAVADELLATLTEALSNVARHAGADAVTVTVALVDGTVTLTVTDDGSGIEPAAPTGSGLANMASRARRLGGTFEVGPGAGRGTEVRWSVPVDGSGT